MASGKHEHAQVISEKGAIPLFARLLSSPHDQIKEQVFFDFFFHHQILGIMGSWKFRW